MRDHRYKAAFEFAQLTLRSQCLVQVTLGSLALNHLLLELLIRLSELSGALGYSLAQQPNPGQARRPQEKGDAEYSFHMPGGPGRRYSQRDQFIRRAHAEPKRAGPVHLTRLIQTQSNRMNQGVIRKCGQGICAG